MQTDLLNAYQSQLIYAAMDDFTVVNALPTIFGGQDGPSQEQWKEGIVLFIYRNLVSGLIATRQQESINAFEFCNLLRNTDPFPASEAPIEWIAYYFEGTKKLEDTLIKFNLFGWEHFRDPPHLEFQQELLDQYAKSGVLI